LKVWGENWHEKRGDWGIGEAESKDEKRDVAKREGATGGREDEQKYSRRGKALVKKRLSETP